MAISDDIRRMSDELARDPASPIFMQLGEALRRSGQTDLALKVAVKGLERHPKVADAHDLLARVYVDKRDFEHAFDQWDKVLQLKPGHLGALKGMGFICYQRERYSDAERYLSAASASDPGDLELASALQYVRSAQQKAARAAESQVPATLADDSRYLFADVLQDEGQTAML